MYIKDSDGNRIPIDLKDLKVGVFFYFLKNSTPKQCGPQWLEMVHPAAVSITSAKGCSSFI